MSRLRIGVVGLGMAVKPHAAALIDLKDDVEVAGCFSPSAERRSAFAETYGLPVVEDLARLLDDPSIQAVMLLTPPNTHLDLVRQAARAGKHVLLEKPLEISLDRSLQLVEAAEQKGVLLGVVLQHRHRPIARELRKMIADRRLGALVAASARLSNWRGQDYYDQPGRGTRARDGGGVLLTQGIHTLDLLISLAGLPDEVSAYATTSAVHRMETEDLAFAAIRYSDGALGGISATTAAYPGYPDALEIIGTKGAARIEGTKLTAQFHDGDAETYEDSSEGGGAGADPMAFSHEHHRAVISDFARAIHERREPMVSGREALKVHRLIDAILRSSQTGQREKI